MDLDWQKNAVQITDRRIFKCLHTPSFSVSDGTLTLNSGGIEINQAALPSAINLETGSKGLKVSVLYRQLHRQLNL